MQKLRVNLKRFRSRSDVPVKLPFPVSAELRLAQLAPAPAFEGVQPFAAENWGQLQNFKPNVMISGVAELQGLAELVQNGKMDVSSVDHALVVLTRAGAKPLNDVSRVTLWQTFGVPIFELYLGHDNSLLACECEVHEGWHVARGVRFVKAEGELIVYGAGNNGLHTGLTAAVEKTPCPCGRASTRLLDIEPMQRHERQYLAQSA